MHRHDVKRRRKWKTESLLSLLIFPLLCQVAVGSIHNSAEPMVPCDNDLGSFLNRLAELRSFGPPDPRTTNGSSNSAAREDYLQKISALRVKEKSGSLTADEAANLGAYLYRVRKTQSRLPDLQEAIQALESARRRYPGHFGILANLGTVYQGTGQLDAAESCLEEALTLAPVEAESPELYQLRLIKRRRAEQRTVGEPPLDALFYKTPRDPLRFVGQSGHYEIGSLAPAELAKLPGGSLEKATRIVQQLLIDFPGDGRLHWLLGELAAAQGQAKAAARALEQAVDAFRLSTPELKQHRAWLLEFVAWSDALDRLGSTGLQTLWLSRALSARLVGNTLPFESSMQFVLTSEVASPLRPKSLFEQLQQEGASKPGTDVRIFGWQMISWPVAVGGAAVILLLVWLQFRQWTRRIRRT